MGWILVTNDDGIESPALVPLVRALEALGPVRAVVPDRERSWIGKAVSRWEPVRVERADRDGCALWKTTGFPADCTQLGIHTLFDEKPSLVVSGINLGFNHGLAFFCSSGTVGAAIEAWIADVPALAVSTGHWEDHATWAGEALEPEARAGWDEAAALAAELAATALEHGLPEGADLLSANFHWGCTRRSPRRLTRLARVGYGRVFQPAADGRYVHEFGGMLRREPSLAGSDLAATRQHTVSLTPVRLAHSEQPSAAERAVWERDGAEGPSGESARRAGPDG